MKNLKVILLAFISTTMISTTVFAQKGAASNQAVSQGNFIIDAFYGYPYFNGSLLQGLSNHSDKVKSTGHIGGKFEYMVSDKIGIGAEFTWADASVKFQNDTTLIYYKAGVSKIRVLGRMNIHFATTGNLDPYFTIGAGYKKTTWYDNEPGAGSFSGNLIPVSVRVGVGLHYYFSDFVGINAEIGLGGPIMQGGLSFKF